MGTKIFWCKRCVSPSTRPRLEFDENGVCNACLYHDEKMSVVDWNERWEKLELLCDKHRRTDGSFDCIIPFSGGKDSSYVAWNFKNKLGMHPLTVTFASQMPTRIGERNFKNSVAHFDNIMITPNSSAYRRFSRDYFISYGLPKQPFVVGISTAIIDIAKRFGVDLICFGENGESEYGGKHSAGMIQKFTREFLTKIYYEGQEDSDKYGHWWRVPSQDDLENIDVTWFSFYEDWDPEIHARFAKHNCGLEMEVGGSIGTFTNYSQIEDALQHIHCYLMFCKFGFGRAVSDASIEIRRNRLTREQGVEVVRKLDGTFPIEYLPAYLSYFNMTNSEFWQVIYNHTNLDLLDRNRDAARPFILKQGVK